MNLCAQVVESLEGLWHKCRRQVVSEIVETHPHQFMLGKPLWAFEGETSPSSNEIGDVSPSLCLVSISSGTPTRLCVLQN